MFATLKHNNILLTHQGLSVTSHVLPEDIKCSFLVNEVNTCNQTWKTIYLCLFLFTFYPSFPQFQKAFDYPTLS